LFGANLSRGGGNGALAPSQWWAVRVLGAPSAARHGDATPEAFVTDAISDFRAVRILGTRPEANQDCALRVDASNVTLPVLLSPLPPVVLASGSSLSRTSGRHWYHNSGQ
jgi:hypothetical protein